MDQGRRLALILLATIAVVGCKSREAPPVAPPVAPLATDAAVPLMDEKLPFTALERVVKIHDLRHELRSQAESELPTGEVPGLDFTRAGNAVVVYRELGMPFITVSKARPFELLPVEDDPYRLTSLAVGIGLRDGEPASTYRAVQYQPVVEQMVRARYVLLVMGTEEQPWIAGDTLIAGTLDANCFLYEIDAAQLLGGFPLHAKSTPDLKLGKGDVARNDQIITDLETNVRRALWAAVKARFPSAITPRALVPTSGGR